MLFIKIMVADGGIKRSVLNDPRCFGSPFRVKEVQAIAHHFCAAETSFCSQDTLSRWRVVDGAVCHRGELNTVFAVEDHTVNAVGKVTAFHPVQNHIADSEFTTIRLAAAFGLNDAGKPVEGITVHFATGRTGAFFGSQGDTGQGAAIINAAVQHFGDAAQGYVQGAPGNVVGSGEPLTGTVEPSHAAVGIESSTGVALDGGAAVGVVPGDPGTAQQREELPQRDISSAVSQITAEGHVPIIVKDVHIPCRSRTDAAKAGKAEG